MRGLWLVLNLTLLLLFSFLNAFNLNNKTNNNNNNIKERVREKRQKYINMLVTYVDDLSRNNFYDFISLNASSCVACC